MYRHKKCSQNFSDMNFKNTFVNTNERWCDI